jgi:GAF domain-containing protein/CheY-like chemotaxis protein
VTNRASEPGLIDSGALAGADPTSIDAFSETIAKLSRQANLQGLAASVLGHMCGRLAADLAVLYVWDAASGALVPRAWVGVGDWIATLRVRRDVGLVGIVASSRSGRITNEYRTSPLALPDELSHLQVEAAMAEPLLQDDRCEGVLWLGRTGTEAMFTEPEQGTLRALAGPFALGLQKVRLVMELEQELQENQEAEAVLARRNRQLESVRDLGAELVREIDLKTLVHSIVERIAELLDAGGCALYLTEERQDLVARDAQGGLSDRYLVRLSVGEGLVGLAAQDRRGHLDNDYHRSPRLPASIIHRSNLGCVMVEPLVFRTRVLGVLEVGRDGEDHPFTEDDQRLLSLGATQAALALEYANVCQDLTQATEQLTILHEDAMRLERLRTLGELSAGIVFGLNQSLTTVIMQAEQLGMKSHDPQVRESVRILAQEASNGASIVRRLRMLLCDRRNQDVQPCDLQKLTLEAIAITSPQWRDNAQLCAREIRVEADIPDSLPAVFGHPEDIRMVLTRMILFSVSNIVVRVGLVTITARHEPDIGGDDGAGSVLITIRDNGMGVSEYSRLHLFDVTIADPVRGESKMGLGIVREMVEGMGGRILGVNSVPETGNVYSLRLRASKASLRPDAPKRVAEHVPGRRVLLVDDHPDVLESTANLLRAIGHEVQTADSGRAALDLFKVHLPDVVITDLTMPGMLGWELARSIKASWATPIVLLTGWGDEMVRSGADNIEFVDAVLHKPTSMQELKRVIAELTAPAPA